MTDVGALIDIIYEQNIKLFIGGVVTRGAALTTASAPDRVTLMSGFDLDLDFPEERFDFGRDRDYSHATPDIGLEFIMHVDKGIIPRLTAMATQNAQNILPIHAIVIEATPAGGAAGDVKRIIGRGKLKRLRLLKTEGGQRSPSAGRVFIRMLDYANASSHVLPT